MGRFTTVTTPVSAFLAISIVVTLLVALAGPAAALSVADLSPGDSFESFDMTMVIVSIETMFVGGPRQASDIEIEFANGDLQCCVGFGQGAFTLLTLVARDYGVTESVKMELLVTPHFGQLASYAVRSTQIVRNVENQGLASVFMQAGAFSVFRDESSVFHNAPAGPFPITSPAPLLFTFEAVARIDACDDCPPFNPNNPDVLAVLGLPQVVFRVTEPSTQLMLALAALSLAVGAWKPMRLRRQ